VAGFVGYVLNIVTYLVVTVMRYELFKPGAPTLSRLAVSFSLTGRAIQGTACLFQPGGLPALWQHGYVVGLVFFGCYCASLGVLILKTRLLLWPPFATTHALVKVPGIVGEAALTLSLLIL
jgi:hypothetical protein